MDGRVVLGVFLAVVVAFSVAAAHLVFAHVLWTRGNCPSTPSAQRLIFEVTTDESTYEVDETIIIKMNITNPTDSEVILNFSSGYQLDYKIISEGGHVIYRWSDGKAFIMAFTHIKVEAHSSYVRVFHHTPKDYPLKPGKYIIEGIVVGYFTDSTEIEVRYNYRELESRYNLFRNITFVFVITTSFFIATTVHFAGKKESKLAQPLDRQSLIKS